jgi:prepilin-type N-terminal cleavage/methylation domain-containing protein
MWDRISKKTSLILKSPAGFTIIELLIAFTILAIVAGSLFQVFYVSEMNNKRAEEADFANNAAKAAIERFKADPVSAESYVRYYDSEWNAASDLVGGSGGLMSDAARYILEADLKKETVSSLEDGDHMNAAAEVVLDSQESYRLVITDATGDLEVQLNGIPQDVFYEGIGATVPIKVFYNQLGILPKKISVINTTDIPIALNIFNVPGNAANDGEGRDELIEVIPVEGSCGVAFYSENRQMSERYLYYMDVAVKKVEASGEGAGGVVELVKYGSSKYVVRGSEIK